MNVTCARWLSVNENVVPTRACVEITARRLPSRHTLADCVTSVSFGFVGSALVLKLADAAPVLDEMGRYVGMVGTASLLSAVCGKLRPSSIGGLARSNIARLDPVTGLPDSFDPNACPNEVDAAAAQLAKLRIFGGLSVEEAGEALGVPRASAFRVWTYARAWLSAALADRTENS